MILFDEPPRQHDLRELSDIVFEYLLVISPGNQLSSALMQIKNILKIKYGCMYAANLIPHITLLNFVQLERNERGIINHLKPFTNSVSPVDIQLDGFGSFGSTTIYANILTKIPITKMAKDIRMRFGKFFQPTANLKPRFTTNPHITIARRMEPVQFNGAWDYLKDQEFKATFRIDELLLLKRTITGGKCEIISRFQLTGSSFSEEQLSLQF